MRTQYSVSHILISQVTEITAPKNKRVAPATFLKLIGSTGEVSNPKWLTIIAVIMEPAIVSVDNFLIPMIGITIVILSTLNALITPVKNKYGGTDLNL